MSSEHPHLRLVGGRLAEASDDRLLEAVAFLDRLSERGAADQLLDPVRPRLALLRPPRPATLERILVLPFEDLLVRSEDHWPERRRIPRSALPPLVRTALGGLEAPLACRLLDELAGQDMRAGAAVLSVGARLWPAAAGLLKARLETIEPDRRRPLAGAAALLGLAPILVPVLWQLPPKPMQAISGPAAAALAPVVRAAFRDGEETAAWLLELLLARSTRSEVVLALLPAPELGLSRRERELHADRLVHDRVAAMSRAAARLRRAGEPSAAEAASVLLDLAADLEALESGWVDSTEDRRLLKDVRTATAELLERSLDRAVGAELLGGLDLLARPEADDDAAVEQLEETARAVRDLAQAGARLGVGGGRRDLLQPYLDLYRERLARQGGDSAGGPSLEQIRVVEILFGPDAAMALLPAGRPATVPSAARPAHRSPAPPPSARPLPSPPASRTGPWS